jgi:5'-nucleotidase
VRGVPIVSSDQHGVGLARIRYCRGPGGPSLVDIERRVAVASSPPRSALGAQVAHAMAPWEERVRSLAEAPVAVLGKGCASKAPNGTRMGDQVARATAERVADAAAPPPGAPVVGLVNVGALRAPLPAAEVRYKDLFNVLPFENTVAACGTTRRGLVRFIENALRKDSSRERFPFGIWGATVRVKRGEGGKLSLAALSIEGEQAVAGDDAPVWLALSDFILTGGDGLLDGVTCAPAATSQTRVREAWRALLAREGGGCEGASRTVMVE